ncbi:MAG: hypothetical protein ACRD8Z_12360 [Nitrososphaeraceae archaeon]
MSKIFQDNSDRKIFLIAISAAVLVGAFVIGSQHAQQAMAQDLGQMGEQIGQQAKERIGGAAEQLGGGNQTGNQTGNQSGGMLGQLGEQAKSLMPGQ